MRFAYVMDPMNRILPDKDTTFAFMRAAQSRGHVSLHCEMRDLFIEGGDAHAIVRPVTVSDQPPYATYGSAEKVRIADVSAVLIRKDPPFDVAYLYATLMLEPARGKTLLVNDPRGIRDANEKLYAAHFTKHMPRTYVGAHGDDIFAFVDSVGGKGVIKPLYGAGGAGVMMLSRSDKNARSIVDMHTNEGRQVVMVQEYLPAVEEGDKRVILLDGKILGAINRVPRSDDLRSNIHVGGRVEACTLSASEEALVHDIVPRLKADGLVFVGLDLIGGKLTEVNVTSPTGIQELSQHRGEDMAAHVIAWLEKNSRAGA